MAAGRSPRRSSHQSAALDRDGADYANCPKPREWAFVDLDGSLGQPAAECPGVHDIELTEWFGDSIARNELSKLKFRHR